MLYADLVVSRLKRETFSDNVGCSWDWTLLYRSNTVIALDMFQTGVTVIR